MVLLLLGGGRPLLQGRAVPKSRLPALQLVGRLRRDHRGAPHHDRADAPAAAGGVHRAHPRRRLGHTAGEHPFPLRQPRHGAGHGRYRHGVRPPLKGVPPRADRRRTPQHETRRPRVRRDAHHGGAGRGSARNRHSRHGAAQYTGHGGDSEPRAYGAAARGRVCAQRGTRRGDRSGRADRRAEQRAPRGRGAGRGGAGAAPRRPSAARREESPAHAPRRGQHDAALHAAKDAGYVFRGLGQLLRG